MGIFLSQGEADRSSLPPASHVTDEETCDMLRAVIIIKQYRFHSAKDSPSGRKI